MSRTGGASAGDERGRGKARCGRGRLRMPCSGNDGVWGGGRPLCPQPAHRGYGGGGDKRRFKENSRVRVASKLDVSQVRWIVREEARGGMTGGDSI